MGVAGRAGRFSLLIVAAGVIGLWWSPDYHRSGWPPVADPGALRREATILCRGEGGWRELAPAAYPPTMTRLRPASISVCGEKVYIGLVPVPGGARFHGYYVWPENAARPGGGIEHEESDDRSLSGN